MSQKQAAPAPLVSEYGFGFLLSFNADAKSQKSVEKFGDKWLPLVMYLAPGRMSGIELCPDRTPECYKTCIFTTGRGMMSPVWTARLNRAKLFANNTPVFMDRLVRELEWWNSKARKQGKRLCVRLNGTSDIAWEQVAPELFRMFSDVQFYDYTKTTDRMFKKLPDNYYLCLSRSEKNDEKVYEVVSNTDGNVAVVLNVKKDQPLPETMTLKDKFGMSVIRPVIDGDLHDLRFMDPPDVFVGLRAKGKLQKLARTGKSKFVVYT